jgi:cell division protein FtsL
MAAAPQLTAGRNRRGFARGVTPEIFFPKVIDNSRLVRVVDSGRKREMALFAIATSVLFVFVMVYAWQHFRAVEYGYRVESVRLQRDNLAEMNRALRLEEASLRDPERIDVLARQIGLAAPQAGQVIRIDAPDSDPGAPVMARANVVPPAAAVPATQ